MVEDQMQILEQQIDIRIIKIFKCVTKISVVFIDVKLIRVLAIEHLKHDDTIYETHDTEISCLQSWLKTTIIQQVQIRSQMIQEKLNEEFKVDNCGDARYEPIAQRMFVQDPYIIEVEPVEEE